MSEYNIVEVDNQESLLPPKIVTFQNGQPNNTNKLKCKSYKDIVNNKRIIAIASDRLTYVGEERENDLFYTVLAIRNKKTNKVRIVPASTISMSVNLSKTNVLLDTTLSNTTMKIGDLYKQFGSKKSKRMTEQYERMQMNVSHVEQELKHSVSNVKIKEDDLITRKEDENNTEYRPKINRNAENVEDVYDVNSIIKVSELNSLKDLAQEIIKNSVTKEQLTSFVLDCVNKLKEASITDIQKYEILLYCDAVLKFFQLPIGMVRKNIKLPPYPENIVEKVLKEFTIFNNNSRQRPLSMRDKAICHVLVLSIIAMNYKLDLEVLTTTIKVGMKKLLEISRILGMQPLTKGNKNNIVLKLPLPAPVTQRRISKKK